MIKQLQIHELRNLKQVNLMLAACNLIVGANGSGKTSLLEVVFLFHEAKAFVIMSLNDISATIKVLVPYGHAQNLKSPVRLPSKKSLMRQASLTLF